MTAQRICLRNAILLTITFHGLVFAAFETIRWDSPGAGSPAPLQIRVSMDFPAGMEQTAPEKTPAEKPSPEKTARAVPVEPAENKESPVPAEPENIALKSEETHPVAYEGADEPVGPPVVGDIAPADVNTMAALDSPTDTKSLTGPGARTTDEPLSEILLSRLDDEIRRRLTYPMAARRRGTEGTVLVLLEIDVDGSLLKREVVETSGSGILDSSALRLLDAIFPYKHGMNRPFTLNIRIVYSLT